MQGNENTVPNTDIGRHVTGYMVNAVFDDTSKQIISNIQTALGEKLGDSLWITPTNSLHITLLDWIAPLVDYGMDKTKLFQEHFNDYDTALQNALRDTGPVSLQFDTIKATPGAIIITASNNTLLDSIRRRILDQISLIEGTKQPPQITHSTIARYRRAIPLEQATELIESHEINFTCNIDRFRLIHEEIAPQLQYELLKEYPIH